MLIGEQQAKLETETLYINGQPFEFDRWTVTTMKAMAYDQGVTFGHILEGLWREALQRDIEELRAMMEASDEAEYGTDWLH